MVPKLLIGILNGFGLMAFIWGILANIGDLKSTILFGMGVLWAAARLIIYIIKSSQDIRWREKHLRNKKT